VKPKQPPGLQGFVFASRLKDTSQTEESLMKNSFARMTGLTASTVRQTIIVLTYTIVLTMAVSMWPNSAFAQSCTPASTAPGSLDTCFGSSGKVTTSLNNTSSKFATDVVIQPDGKLVVAAYENPPSGSKQDFLVLRYGTAGLLDPTFGNGGVARISFTTSGSELPNALAIQSDGKIIVAGYAPLKSYSAFAVARLNPNGSLDTLFGTGGKVLFSFQNNVTASVQGVTIQSNGYIVVAGRSNAEFALARFTPTGAFDPGFNGNGRVTISTANSTDTLVGGAYDVTTQRVLVGGVIQEKLVAAGIRPRLAGVDRDIAVLRFNPNGSLDSSFGSGGRVFTNFTGFSDQAKAVAIDANNNIVVAGHTLTDSVSGGQRFALVRYTENGQLDAGFGNGGKVTAGTPSYNNAFYGHGLAIQPDGKIVASGYIETSDFTYADFAISRFNANGTLDTTFGPAGTGTEISDFYGDKDHGWGGLVLQADGRIVVVGGAYPLPQQIALVRYMP
jgi:uncharacterized delta-60 repeat protein